MHSSADGRRGRSMSCSCKQCCGKHWGTCRHLIFHNLLRSSAPWGIQTCGKWFSWPLSQTDPPNSCPLRTWPCSQISWTKGRSLTRDIPVRFPLSQKSKIEMEEENIYICVDFFFMLQILMNRRLLSRPVAELIRHHVFRRRKQDWAEASCPWGKMELGWS